MKLMVEVDGQTLPLSSCRWVLFDADGCAFGSIYGDTAVNAEQAHKEFAPLKRHRDKQIREGYTVRLLTSETTKKAVDACFLGTCVHLRREAAL